MLTDMTVNTCPIRARYYALAVVALWLLADWLGVVVAAVILS